MEVARGESANQGCSPGEEGASNSFRSKVVWKWGRDKQGLSRTKWGKEGTMKDLTGDNRDNEDKGDLQKEKIGLGTGRV